MKKKKKLQVRRQTIRVLDRALVDARGGGQVFDRSDIVCPGPDGRSDFGCTDDAPA